MRTEIFGLRHSCRDAHPFETAGHARIVIGMMERKSLNSAYARTWPFLLETWRWCRWAYDARHIARQCYQYARSPTMFPLDSSFPWTRDTRMRFGHQQPEKHPSSGSVICTAGVDRRLAVLGHLTACI